MAAEKLFISQPSVSQAIKELESIYRVKLFERYPKQLFPTEEGDLLYHYAREILGLYDEASRQIQFLSNNAAIQIGANISVGTVLIHQYIEEFRKVYPDVTIDVKVTGSVRLSQLLKDHVIEFALMEDLLYDNRLIQEPFMEDRILLVCSPEHDLAGKKRITYRSLAGRRFLLREPGVGVRDKFDYLLKSRDISIEIAWESSDNIALIHAAKRNYGIAVVPYLLVKDELDKGELVILDLKDDALKRNLNISYHKDKIFNKWTQAFIDIVKSGMHETP